MGWEGVPGRNASVRENRKSEKARRVIRFKSDSLAKDGRRAWEAEWKCPRLCVVWGRFGKATRELLRQYWWWTEWVPFLLGRSLPLYSCLAQWLAGSSFGRCGLHISLDGIFRALKIGPLVSYTSYSSNYHARQQNTLVKRGALDLYYCVNFNLSSATYYLCDVGHIIYPHYASILTSVKWGQYHYLVVLQDVWMS